MDCTHVSEAEEGILAILETRCKASRRLHCLSVANVAESLCLRFGLDPRLGRLAGLGHDIVKDWPIAEQWILSRRASDHVLTATFADLVSSLCGNSEYADSVIHGPAGAVFLLESGLVLSEEVLGSIAFHSTARLGMGPLEKLVFAADKLEAGRRGAGPEESQALDTLGLEDLFFYSLQRSMYWLTAKGGAIAQSTLDLYNALELARRGT